MKNETNYLCITAGNSYQRGDTMMGAVMGAAHHSCYIETGAPFEFALYRTGVGVAVHIGHLGDIWTEKGDPAPVLIRKGKLVRRDNPLESLWDNNTTDRKMGRLFGLDLDGDPLSPDRHVYHISEISYNADEEDEEAEG